MDSARHYGTTINERWLVYGLCADGRVPLVDCDPGQGIAVVASV